MFVFYFILQVPAYVPSGRALQIRQKIRDDKLARIVARKVRAKLDEEALSEMQDELQVIHMEEIRSLGYNPTNPSQ